MAGWEIPLGIVLTIFGGIALAVQAGINASLAVNTTKPFAAVFSFGVGMLACCLYLLIDATAISKQMPTMADMAGAPWWAWIGGVLGAYYVVVNISFAYKLGAGTAVAVFVCSQLGMSVVLDLTGLVGFQKRTFSWPRIVGALLMIVGVILVTQFPGTPVPPPDKQLQEQDPLPQQQQQQQQQQKDQAVPDKLQEASSNSLLRTAPCQGNHNSSNSSSSNGSSVWSSQVTGAGSSSSNSSSHSSGRRLRSIVHRPDTLHVQQPPPQSSHHCKQQQQQQQRDVELGGA